MPRLVRLARPVLILVLALAPALAGAGTPAGAEVARTRVDVMTVFGQPGDPVTGGQSRVWRSGPDEVSLRRVGDGVEIRGTSAGGEPVVFRVLPRVDEPLTYGQYSATSATPTADGPGMSLSIGHRTCAGAGTSTFEVQDVTADLTRLWLTFEQRCEGASGRSFGEIRFHEEDHPGVLLAPSRVVFPDRPVGSAGESVPVTVFNTGPAPVTFSGATIAGEATKTPISPIGNDPIGVAGLLNFGVAGNTCGTVPPGGSCVVTVAYRPVFPGSVQAHLRLTTAAGTYDMSLAGVALTPTQPEWQS